mgnify:CR=1 FL=1
MRRKDREITDIEEIRDIIEKCKVRRRLVSGAIKFWL